MSAQPAIVKPDSLRTRTVALVGNPNTGKSTLFNALTGYHQRVGNYPGVTVETRTGRMRVEGHADRVDVVDLPGTYSLAARSADEAVVLDRLLGAHDQAVPDAIVVVVDASNLSRNLFLTSQLMELGRPVIVALNMMDVAEAQGTRIDSAKLARELGLTVVPVVATKSTGLDSLRRAILESMDTSPPASRVSFPACIQTEQEGLCDLVNDGSDGARQPLSHAEALQTLLNPGGYHEKRVGAQRGPSFARDLTERRERIAEAGESLVEVEARVRYARIAEIVARVVTRSEIAARSFSDRLDRVLTHRIAGSLVLAVLMAACFQSIYSWSVPLIDTIDGAFGLLGALLSETLPEGPLQSMLVDGVIAGVGAVLVFLPQIVILFLFLAIMEDCGYMARAAFLLDRWMGLIGLNGRSFVPLLSSFACAIPGIMATRTIEDRSDRFVTILIAPLMSCSARLPVYMLLIAAFIPATPLLGGLVTSQVLVLFAMYSVGTVVAILVALVLKRTVLKGESVPFLMELPTFKWPSTRTVLYRAYEQGREFTITAGTIIFAVTIVIWALGYYPRSATITQQYEAQRVEAHREHATRLGERDTATATPLPELNEELERRLTQIDQEEAGAFLEQSVLGRMGHWIEPIVLPLGWDWRIGTAAIAAFPAREVLIATMGTIYNLGAGHDETSVGLRSKLQNATWPDGRHVFNIPVALSIMVFFALCCQCGATLAVIKRETRSWRWPLIAFAYMTTLAYVGAFITFQVASRLV